MSSLKELLAKRKAAEAAANETEIKQCADIAPTEKTVSGTGTGTVTNASQAKSEIAVSPTVAQVSKSSSDENANLSPDVLAMKMSLAELRQQLDEQIPGFGNLLREIHLKLKNDPAIVTILSNEDRKIIIDGLMKHSQIEVVAPGKVKSAKAAVSKTKIGADDL